MVRSEIAYQTDQNIRGLTYRINASFLDLGKELKKMRDERLYEELDYDTFESYIAQPELSMKRTGIYRLIGIYETFITSGKVPQRDIEEIDYNKLDMIRRFSDKNEFGEWIEKARTLSRSDLQKEIIETTGTLQECTEHEPEVICRCKNCGQRLMVKEAEALTKNLYKSASFGTQK